VCRAIRLLPFISKFGLFLSVSSKIPPPQAQNYLKLLEKKAYQSDF